MARLSRCVARTESTTRATAQSGINKRIGNAEEEGKGGQMRALLLSNRATTLVKASVPGLANVTRTHTT